MNLTNSELLAQIKQLALEERRVTLALIEHLEEMERRKLHLELGFGSLYDYCTRELGMSEGSAHRRISAMRLAKAAPEIKASIENGKLTLTNAAQVHQFAQMERKAGREVDAAGLAREMEGLSKRDCERKLADVNPSFLPAEKERVLSASETQITFVASRELLEELEQLRQEWSHVNPNFTYAELFSRMAKMALKKSKTRVPSRSSDVISSSTSPAEATGEVGNTPQVNVGGKTRAGVGPGRAIPSAVQRKVFERDQGCVQCGSKFQIEIDHIQPWAHGGGHELSNLQTLCQPHHRLKTERETPDYAKVTSFAS